VTTTSPGATSQASPAIAWRFVFLLGIVSLFADMTYEGARSVTGPYLGVLGASGTIVGFVAGFGELVGYGLRLISGYLSDRTRRYWAITIAGYGINLLAVPAIALAGRWEVAAALMIAERTGKALRTPARDAMLSHAATGAGHGRSFGVHEAMDQIGAILGPLIVAGVLAWRDSYEAAFGMLAVPAVLALGTLLIARRTYPNPEALDSGDNVADPDGLPQAFWLYMVAAGLVAMGFADFPLMAYHFEQEAIFSATIIPIAFAIAMAVDALAALLFGGLFDRIGIRALVISIVFSAGFAPFAFLGGSGGAITGVVLWGIGMGAQESIMRAGVARMAPRAMRGTAFGIFNTGFGLFWFAGSALMGVLYDTSRPMLVIFSVAAQLAGIPVLLALVHRSAVHTA